jgi:hypothetical protein
MMLGRRKLLAGLGAFVALSAATLLLADRDERRIRQQIAELEAALERSANEDQAVRALRVERALSELVAEDVVVSIPEHPEMARGRGELTRLALRAGADPRGVEIGTRNVEVRLDSNRRAATVTFSAELSRPGDELHKHVRAVRLRCELRSEAWRVTSVEVAPETREEPEARP